MTVPVRRALYGKLAGDTTLNAMLGTPPSGWTKSIYYSKGPDNANFPFVVFDRTSGIPTHTFGKPVALEEDIWLVKVVDRALSADTAEAAAARVDTLLNDAALSVSGADLLYLRRMSSVDYDETDQGVTYRHSGGNYRLITAGTA